MKAIEQAQTRLELFDFLKDFYRQKGFSAFCYAVPSEHGVGEIEVLDFGYPPSWMARYAAGLGLHDPVISHAMASGSVFRWSDIGRHTPLTSDNRAFLDELGRSGLSDGFAMPTYGRHQRVGFFGIGEVAHEGVLETCDILTLHAVAQLAHNRLDQICETSAPPPRLSPREVEILHWIARGKSNTDLATIIGISAATVATYLQRVFAKIGTNDRVSAAVLAAKRGLIHV